MRRKNLVFISFIALFVISVFMIEDPAASSAAPTVSVSPSNIFDLSMDPGAQFTVDITVDYVESLLSYQFLMFFDPDVLHGVSVEPGPFLSSAGGSPIWYPGVGFNNDLGVLYLVIEALPPPPATPPSNIPSGGGVLATVTFEVVGYGKSSLFLGSETGLLNPEGEWITYGPEYISHGYFANTVVWHDIALTSLTTDPPVFAPQGDPLTISVTVENQGDFVETFDVSVYADRNVGDLHFDIGVQTVQDLQPRDSETLTFIWDTTDVAVGSYVISAEVDAVSGEIGHTTNNVISTPFEGITIPQHEVTLLDLVISWVSLAVRVALPVAVFATIVIVFLKIATSVKMRWPIRLWKRELQ